MKLLTAFFLTLVTLAPRVLAGQNKTPCLFKHQVYSPNGRICLTFMQCQATNNARVMHYAVTFMGKPIIDTSLLDVTLDNHLSEQAMGLKVDHHANWCENLVVTGADSLVHDTAWAPVCGENNLVQEHYHALTIHLVKDDNPMYRMDVEIRAFNQGVAFRYFFPENEKGTYYRIMRENTSFRLPQGAKGWVCNWAQGPYTLLEPQQWVQEAERPLTLQLPGGTYVCLAEAAMTDYARTKFTWDSGAGAITTSVYTPVDLISPVGTPWRVIVIAEDAPALVQSNNIILSLNAPPQIAQTGWIKPGKIMRVMSQTTKDALENIDFAVKHHLQYILFDWKWYGQAFSFASDATKVAIPNFDLPKIISYGQKKGVGVWLYVNQQALLAQSDSLFRVYRSWGVKGVKFGFVQVGSHRWTNWLEDMFKKAAAEHIMVNVHDDWRPTGEQRTWPNLMTAEGIRGNEEMPTATHNTILPFTRFMCGSADYTICYFDKRIKTTHTHQLALAAVYYSPLQTLYWYDKPVAAQNAPELEFWDHISTTWDETKVLDGEPGQYITTARRKGREWFIGAITNNSARDVAIDFSFLPPGQKFAASFYLDDESAPTPTKVSITRSVVDAASKLQLHLNPSGGAAIWLRPQ